MIADAGHHMVAGPHKAVNRHVQTVRTIEREDDPLGIGDTQQLRNRVTRVLDSTFRFGGLTIGGSARRCAQVALISVDRLINALGLRPTGGGIVEINTNGLGHGEWTVCGIRGVFDEE